MRLNAESLTSIDLTKYMEGFKKIIQEGVLELSCDEYPISMDLVNFIDRCFKFNIEDRASADELLIHPFITRYSISDVLISEKTNIVI